MWPHAANIDLIKKNYKIESGIGPNNETCQFKSNRNSIADFLV